MKTIEIKKCPFCKSKQTEVAPARLRFKVACYRCGATGPIRSRIRDCIYAWNGKKQKKRSK